MGISSFQSWLKKLGDPKNGRWTKILGFISKIKLRKSWLVTTKKMRIMVCSKAITRISGLNMNQTMF